MIEKIVSAILPSVSQKADKLREMTLRTPRETLIVEFPNSVSLLVVTVESKDPGSQHTAYAGYHTFKPLFDLFNASGRDVQSFMLITKNVRTDLGVMPLELWSCNPAASIVMYSVAARFWRGLLEPLSMVPSLNSLLRRMQELCPENVKMVEGTSRRVFVCGEEASKVHVPEFGSEDVVVVRVTYDDMGERHVLAKDEQTRSLGSRIHDFYKMLTQSHVNRAQEINGMLSALSERQEHPSVTIRKMLGYPLPDESKRAP